MDPARFFAASRVLIVAGKGGVGKSTMSAVLARAAARSGLSTLVVRLAPGGAIGNLYGRTGLGTAESTLHPGGGPSGDADVRTRLITADEALSDYLDDHGMARITRRLVSTGAIDVVTTAAPGIRDLLVLGRVKALEMGRAADLIILDAPAAGHAISFLQSPTGLLEAVGAGPIATQATDVLEMLADPARCRVILVTLPEETPVNEVIETAFALEDEVGVHLGPVIVNGLLPRTTDGVGSGRSDASSSTTDIEESLLRSLEHAAAFDHAWRSRQGEQLDRLVDELPLPRLEVPLLTTTDPGPSHLELLSDAILGAISRLDDPDEVER